MGQDYTTDRRLLEQVDIGREQRARASRNLAMLQESGVLTAKSAGPLVRGTREAMQAQLDFLEKTQAEPPGQEEPPFKEWDWRTGIVNPAWVRQGISRMIAKRGDRYDAAVYEKAGAMLDYLFAPMDTKEKWDAYLAWAANPNASYEDMPPGAFVPELIVGAFNIPGGVQALRDIWRSMKEEVTGEGPGVDWFTALDAAGAIPIAGMLVTMAAHGDDVGRAAKRFALMAEMTDLAEDAARPGRAMPETKRLLRLAEEDPEAFALMNVHRVEDGAQPITIERLTFVENNRMERELPHPVVTGRGGVESARDLEGKLPVRIGDEVVYHDTRGESARLRAEDVEPHVITKEKTERGARLIGYDHTTKTGKQQTKWLYADDVVRLDDPAIRTLASPQNEETASAWKRLFMDESGSVDEDSPLLDPKTRAPVQAGGEGAGDTYTARKALRDEVNGAYARLERQSDTTPGPGYDRSKPGAWNPKAHHLVNDDEIVLYRRTQEPAVLDPESPKSRTGHEGAERKRRENYGDDFPARTNWYTEDATVEPEFHNFQHEVAIRVKRDRLYDIDADPEGWVEAAGPGGNFTDFEAQIKQHPDYDGIISPSSGRVDVFEDMEANVLDRVNLRTGEFVPVPEASRASHERNLRAIYDKYEDQPSWVGGKYADDYVEEHRIPDEWREGPHSDYLSDRYNMPREDAARTERKLEEATREIVEGELGTVNAETFRTVSLREGGRTIGQLKYSLFGTEDALVSWIGVGEDSRRTGAASELWEYAMERIGDRNIHVNDLTDDGSAFVSRMGTDVTELGTVPILRVGPFDSPEPSLSAHFAERARLGSKLRISSKASGADVVANHFSEVGGLGGSSTRYGDAVNMGALDEGYVGALGERVETMLVSSEADLTPEVIDEFIRRNADRLGGEEGLAVGTWTNPKTGEVEVDISKVFEDQSEAVKYAAAHGHDAVWDLKNGVDVNTREHTGMERYMTPEERVLYLDDDGFPSGKIVQMWGQAPTARELASAAGRGAAARGWYRASSAALVDVFGEDAPRFAAMLAAMSPQTSVEENLKATLLFWNKWDGAGRPTDRVILDQLMAEVVPPFAGAAGAGKFDHAVFVPESARNNVWRAVSSQDPVMDFYLSGAKVDSFHQNLMQDVDRVTMDTWGTKYMGMNPDHLNSRNATLASLQTPEYKRYMGTQAELMPVENLPGVIEEVKPGAVRVEYVKKDGTIGEGIRRQGQYDAAGGIGVASPGYAMSGALHREAADLMTQLTGVKWTGEEIQETAWSLFKSVIDQDPTHPERWMDLLRETDDAQIAKAADFSTLLQEDGYRELATAGGRPGAQPHGDLRGADIPEGVVREGDLENLVGRAQRHKETEVVRGKVVRGPGYDIPSLLLPFGGGSLLGAHFLQQQEEKRRGGLLE